MNKAPKHIFRPRARIMTLLGEQLIKNHTLALFELVKNSYDADASEVSLVLSNINTPNGAIYIKDDGSGMSYETVTNIWLEPAHSHKSDSKIAGIRTSKGRLPVGEKGVGRFAVHRLGDVITMVTRSGENSEVVVKIDWDKFLENDYLDESEIEIFERTPEVFIGSKTGTEIQISGLRQNWRRGDVRKLFKAVNSMTPALLIEEGEDIPEKYKIPVPSHKNKFAVKFQITPEENWLEGMFDSNMAISQSLFQFDFCLNENGLSYKYNFSPFLGMKADYPNLLNDRCLEVENLRNFDFFKSSSNDEDGTNYQGSHKNFVDIGMGEIKGRIIAYDFDKEIFSRYQKDISGGLQDYVKEQGGIRVYRDGLRIYNYGEPGDDWLNLNHRRIQSPTKTLGSSQMIGILNLDLESSPNLIEKTNREGFVENNAYNKLVSATLTILKQFEVERNKDKRRLKEVLTIVPGSKKTEVKRKKTVEELFDELSGEILKDKVYEPLRPVMSNVTKAYSEARNVLMSAAGAGMGLVTVFHEMERGVRGLHHAIKEGLPIEKLQGMSEELVFLLKGAMYMVNTKSMETINASKLVDYVLLTQNRRFSRHGVTFINGFKNGSSDFEIKGIRRMLTTTLVNLLDNAIYWTDNNEEEKYIWIGSSMELEGPAIVIADNGPGFIDAGEDLVQPFFTRKPNGMGIGLYYSDMVMKTMGGRLAFPEIGAIQIPAVVNGSCIGMVFDSNGKAN